MATLLLQQTGFFMPMNEDSRDEELFLNCNDPLHHPPIPFEEFADWGNTLFAQHNDEDDRDLTDRLCDTKLTAGQIAAAVPVMIENPELLINLYREATNEEEAEESPRLHRLVEEKLIGFLRGVFAAMLKTNPAKNINRSLMLRRDGETGKSLLSCLADFARQELKREARRQRLQNARKPCPRSYPCAALAIMRSLGHNDVFASYLG